MHNNKTNRLDASQAHLWIIGGGIAGMAAAAFAIRDAKVPAKNIHILEELDVSGGSMDGGHTPHAAQAWVTRGGRMLTDETYLCLWDLFSSIPSLENPEISVREECREFNEQIKTHAQARLIDAQHVISDASKLGLNTRHRAQMLRLLAAKEEKLAAAVLMNFSMRPSLKRTFGVCGVRHLPSKNGTVQQNFVAISYVLSKSYHVFIPLLG